MTPVAAEDDVEWGSHRDQAEIAAEVQEELDDDDDDPFGVLDFEANFESDEEEEVREAISKYKLGQWMDGVVDAMLQIEDVQPDIEKQEESISDVEAPPARAKGWWDDVSWFGRLLTKTVKS